MSKRAFRTVVAGVAVAAVVAGSTLAWSSTRSRDAGVGPDLRGGVTTSTGSCPSTKSDWASADGIMGPFTSTTFVNLTGMNKQFKVKGPGKSCAIVQFTSYGYIGTADIFYVRATIDGHAITPLEVQFTGDDDENSNSIAGKMHSATFVTKPLGPGLHRARIQVRTLFGGSAYLGDAVMTISHR